MTIEDQQAPSSPPAQATRWTLHSRVGTAAIGAFGLLLAYLIVTHTGAAYVAKRSPELALWLNPNDTEALIAVAQQILDDATALKPDQRSAVATGSGEEVQPSAATTEPTDADVASRQAALAPGTRAAERISELANRAVLLSPVDPRPLRLLAQLADAAGDKPLKYKLLQAAFKRSKHDPIVAYWLMVEAIEKNEYANIVLYADVVMSNNLSLAVHVAPALARLAENNKGIEELNNRLKENPVWRAQFFDVLHNVITDARTPLDILLSLKGSAHPPTTAEMRNYINFLISKKLYELSYYVWLQFLEPNALSHVALVNNGSFESTPTTMPYDWAIRSSPGTNVDIRSPPGEANRALFVEFVGQGRVEFDPVHQSLALAPGRYRLKLKQKGEIVGRRGLQWSIVCLESARAIGESPMLLGAAATWQAIRVEFEVPSANCRAQRIQLTLPARSVSELIVRGSAWFDEVGIERQNDE